MKRGKMSNKDNNEYPYQKLPEERKKERKKRHI